MGSKTKLLSILFSGIISFLILLCIPLYAYAGTSDSPGGGAGSTGGGGAYNPGTWIGNLQWYYTNVLPDGRIVPAGAYVICPGGPGWMMQEGTNWVRFNLYFGMDRCFPGLYGDGQLSRGGAPLTDPRLADEAKRNGYYAGDWGVADAWWGPVGIYWWRNGVGQGLDAVWIDKRVEDCSEATDVLVYTECDDDDNGDIDDRKLSAEQLWHRRDQIGTYKYHTAKTEGFQGSKKEVKGGVQTVVHQQTRCIDGDVVTIRDGIWAVENGEIVPKDLTAYRTQGGVRYFSNTVNYSCKHITFNTEYYRPFNLNRNGYAENADKSYGGDNIEYYLNSGDAINGSVDNRREITDNSVIETLDINNDAQFSLKFNNNNFGLPNNKNWNNTPWIGKVPNEFPQPKSGAYCNGYNNAAGDDCYRYDLQVNAGIGDINNGQLTSLKDLSVTNDEKITGTDMEYKYGSLKAGVTNTWGARTIMAGSFKLGSESKSFPNWWTLSYTRGLFYEFGASYSGTITKNGVNAPSRAASSGIDHKTGLADGTAGLTDGASYNGFNITTNPDQKQTGLWVGFESRSFENPLLCGKFEAKTIAGNLK